ncbi:39S ribosomal protein L30, mitochondrial [Callorhinchus milii]|nr:39S ribosomal protein L30, mitochondrial [Callorhinchus milii]
MRGCVLPVRCVLVSSRSLPLPGIGVTAISVRLCAAEPQCRWGPCAGGGERPRALPIQPRVLALGSAPGTDSPSGEREERLMAGLCRAARGCTRRLGNLTEKFLIPLSWTGFVRLKFTKSRIPEKMFEVHPSDHEKYGGDPEQPHQLHIITRIKSGKRRPYWEKKIVHDLGLGKSNQPRIHKNIPSVNQKLKIIKHLISIQPLKLPQGLPTEEKLAATYLNSKGELIIRQQLLPLEEKTIES